MSAPEVFGFLLAPRFSMMALMSATEPLRVANRLSQRELYRCQLISRDGAPVTASNHMTLASDHAIGHPAIYTKMVVCAGFDPEANYDRRTDQWLRNLAHEGVALGAVDTGSFFLAWSGLLDGYQATTHWEGLDSLREQFPKINVAPGVFVVDRSRFTCAGGTAAIDMMLHLIRAEHGHRLAAAVAEQLIHSRIRDPQERQRMDPHLRQGVVCSGLARAIELMENCLEEPLDMESLCHAAGVSRRQLERMFHRHFRVTPRRYYLDLRLQRARSLLQYTNRSIVEISVACGFGSATHFSRSYHDWAGKPPTAERLLRETEITPSLR